MDHGGTSCNTRTNNKKKESRRVWTKAEEEALLNILDVIVAEGGRTENGTFKAGTNLRIEKELSKILPNCDLRASPHIESKMRKWKKKYVVLFDMLNTSGFRWNNVKKCVQVDSDSVWESYVQSHREVRKWRNRPIPLFERLISIFGTNRGMGIGAETPGKMVGDVNRVVTNDDDPEEVNRVVTNDDDPEEVDRVVTNDDDPDDLEVDDGCSPVSVAQPSTSQHTVRSQSENSSRKRGRSRDNMIVGIKDVATVFQRVYTQSIERMEMLAERIFSDKEDRSDIVEELTTMGLTEDDELDALTLILEKPSNISAFKSLRGERKLAFVQRLLRKRSSG